MTGDWLHKARTDLEVASLLIERGFLAQAISRSYYATFYAARAALAALGERTSTHSGLISAFGRLVVVKHGFDSEVGASLRTLFEERGVADYDLDPSERFTEQQAEQAVVDARSFVDAVAEWIEGRQGER